MVRLAITAATVAALAVGSTAHASTLDLFGFGARSPALAGAGVATADDYEAVYANPAGLADARHKRATVGALLANFDLTLDDNDAGVDTASGVMLGGSVPIPLGGAGKDRVGLGFGFYVPNSAISRVRQPFPGEPSYALLANRSHVVALQVAVGVRLTRAWSVGFGVIALAALRGSIDVSTDPGGHFVTSSEQRLLTRFAPVLGARLRRGALAVGAVVRAPSRADYDLTVVTDLGDALPLTLPTIRIAGTAQYDPLTVAAEAAWQRGPVTVMGQLAWQRWSAFPLPSMNPVTGTPAQQPPNFHDTLVPRLAAEWTHTHGALTTQARAGYALLLSPAPEQRGQQSLLDNHRHLLAVGAGVALAGAVPLHLDVFAQVHLLQARTHTKDATLQVGDAPVPFAAIETGGHVIVVGATLGVDL